MSEPKIEGLPGIKTSPKAFCGMLLEQSDDMEHIAVVVQWKGGKGTTNVFFTSMNSGQAAWMDYVFHKNFMLEVTEDEE